MGYTIPKQQTWGLKVCIHKEESIVLTGFHLDFSNQIPWSMNNVEISNNDVEELSKATSLPNQTCIRSDSIFLPLLFEFGVRVCFLAIDVQEQPRLHVPGELHADEILVENLPGWVSSLDLPFFIKSTQSQIEFVSLPPYSNTCSVFLLCSTGQDVHVTLEVNDLEVEFKVKAKGTGGWAEKAGVCARQLEVLIHSVEQESKATQGSSHQGGGPNHCEVEGLGNEQVTLDHQE